MNIYVVEKADGSGIYLFPPMSTDVKYALLFTDDDFGWQFMQDRFSDLHDWCMGIYPDYDLHFSDILSQCDYSCLHIDQNQCIMFGK